MAVNWIVMPTYECASLTRQALESALAQDIGNVRVLVVDASSVDGVAPWLRSLGKQTQLISLPKAAGVSRAWNAALSFIFDSCEAGEALVINSDVRLRPDAYRRLRDDGGLFVTCVGTSSGAAFPGGEPSGERRPHPDFSCFLIRRECWERVGPFDTSTSIYCGDGDYHLRMNQAGIKAYCIDLPFYHYASGTLKNVDPEERERILKQADGDRKAFEAKWGCAMGSPEYYKLFNSTPPPEGL